MRTLVYKFGARPAGSDIRDQMRLGHEYYNRLVEAENERRRRIWGADTSAPPEHECGGDRKCSVCKDHFAAIRERAKGEGFLDVKPYRAEAAKRGLYWGTYLKVEDAFSAAQKKRPIHKPVRFRPWRDGAIAAVQVQKAAKAENLYLIDRAPDHRTGRRAGQRSTVRIRVGSEERAPVWSGPVRFERHREIQGRVAWVIVKLEHEANRERWSVHFVCRDVPARDGDAESGVVAVDVGWRVLPDGWLRVAYARGDDGRERELSLPPRWRELADRSDRIRAHRDDRLNELKAQNQRFARALKPSGVVRIARREGIDITEWERRDRHLWQYEVGCRRRSYARRRNDVRAWLRALAREYAVVVVKDSAHKGMKEKARAGKELRQRARYQGHHGAPGEVIEEIVRKVWPGAAWIAEAHGTSRACASCDHEMDVGGDLILRCERCGAAEDRDARSTRNLMDAYARGEVKSPTARKTAARFAKRHVQ